MHTRTRTHTHTRTRTRTRTHMRTHIEELQLVCQLKFVSLHWPVCYFLQHDPSSAEFNERTADFITVYAMINTSVCCGAGVDYID